MLGARAPPRTPLHLNHQMEEVRAPGCDFGGGGHNPARFRRGPSGGAQTEARGRVGGGKSQGASQPCPPSLPIMGVKLRGWYPNQEDATPARPLCTCQVDVMG